MSVDLVLLTDGTSINEVFDKGCEIQPPEVALKDSFSMEDAHVARRGGRMQGME